MAFGLGSYGLGLLAGVLSTLSPCVLPILPILIGSATTAHPRAPLALAGGLALSYALIGTLIAWLGASVGLDTAIFKNAGAVLLGILGVVLVSPNLQQYFATATSGVGNTGNNLINRLNVGGLGGQFVIGLALGVVWSPCVGPTLGAAIVLASRGDQLLQVALMMGLFGIGAALPVLTLAFLSRAAMLKMRGQLLSAGKAGKKLLGLALLIVATLILTGIDKSIETWLVLNSPQWLTELTTRF